MSEYLGYVYINQQQKVALEHGKAGLKHLLTGLDIDTSTLAVAVNNDIVPRGQWDAYQLNDGDNINVFGAIAGG